jgi:hypothetical protein
VRKAAVFLLRDPILVAEIAQKDSSRDVRAAAETRLQKLNADSE